MELDYRLEADNQRAFAKAYAGHPRFAVPQVVASAPKVVVQEWIEGVGMAQIIAGGSVEQRDLLGARLVELIGDAPARVGMVHGDAHPGNFMLLPDGRMGVIDFGAVAPLPDGLPVELGMALRFAGQFNYDLLLPTLEKAGFIQPGAQISVEEVDEMLRRYVEPVAPEVFHFSREWLQKLVAAQLDQSIHQIKTARQLNLPPNLAVLARVVGTTVAILAQLDAHVPVRAIALELLPGFAG